MADDPSADPSVATLLDMIAGHRITAVIYTAVQLGIPEVLDGGPTTAADVATQIGAHEDSVRRLLRALVALDLCAQHGDRFELTAMGRRLSGRAPGSLRPWAVFEGQLLSRSWGGLLESIRTGKTASQLAGIAPEEQFAQMAKAGIAEVFNEAMVAMTRQVAPAVVAAYDFAGVSTLSDVGGGHGELIAAILSAHPAMRGTVFDLPQCAEGARRHLAETGLSGRCEFVAGSFFDAVPSGSDALIMKSIIHDWDDARSLKILGNCRRALAATGRLLLVERQMPEVPSADIAGRLAVLSDLNMLRGPGGCERTEAEYRALLAQAGFQVSRVLPAGLVNVIEATCA
jgi:O-methyltransferase/methyltransferase family protein